MYTVHWDRYYPLALCSHMCDVQNQNEPFFCFVIFHCWFSSCFPFIIWWLFFQKIFFVVRLPSSVLSPISFDFSHILPGSHSPKLQTQSDFGFWAKVGETGAHPFQFYKQKWFAKLHPFFSDFNVFRLRANTFIFPFLFAHPHFAFVLAVLFSFHFSQFLQFVLAVLVYG